MTAPVWVAVLQFGVIERFTLDPDCTVEDAGVTVHEEEEAVTVYEVPVYC